MNSTNPTTQDFQRDVYCLFGLPVDNLSMEGTKALLREKANQEGSVVLSTINVNWIVQSFASPSFRAAILNSDVVTIDGKPLLWLARLFGCPMTEVVPGSTLIHKFHQDRGSAKPLSIFLFGGEDGVAEQARERINSDPGGLKAVGALNPGFGTIEQMSSDGIINAINNALPDILLVALGAKKGTQWIEHNRQRLNAKIISHLGATINFLAGTVQRAPKLVRKFGMEWVWRILQEPKLFIRYAFDGLVLVRLVATPFFSWLCFMYLNKKFGYEESNPILHLQVQENEIILTIGRNARISKDSTVKEQFCECATFKKDITIDFQKTEFVDGAFMGLLFILMKHQRRSGKKLVFINVHGRLAELLRLFYVEEELKGADK